MARLTYEQSKQVVVDYLSGVPIPDIAKKYSIHPTTVKRYIANHPRTRAELEEELVDMQIAYENARIAQIKDKILDFCEQAVDEAMAAENKIYYFTKLKDILHEVDQIARLNEGKATSIQETRNMNTNVDVAKLMEKFKSPDDIKQYLLSKLHKNESGVAN